MEEVAVDDQRGSRAQHAGEFSECPWLIEPVECSSGGGEVGGRVM